MPFSVLICIEPFGKLLLVFVVFMFMISSKLPVIGLRVMFPTVVIPIALLIVMLYVPAARLTMVKTSVRATPLPEVPILMPSCNYMVAVKYLLCQLSGLELIH